MRVRRPCFTCWRMTGWRSMSPPSTPHQRNFPSIELGETIQPYYSISPHRNCPSIELGKRRSSFSKDYLVLCSAMVADPDPHYFWNWIRIRIRMFFLLIRVLLKIHLQRFSKIKVLKKSQYSRNQCFSYYFCLMIEGSGSDSLTEGSGSGRPRNMWILRIRIRNTALEAKRSQWRPGGSQWSPGWSLNQWSQIRITSMRSRIPIRIRVKS